MSVTGVIFACVVAFSGVCTVENSLWKINSKPGTFRDMNHCAGSAKDLIDSLKNNTHSIRGIKVDGVNIYSNCTEDK